MHLSLHMIRLLFRQKVTFSQQLLKNSTKGLVVLFRATSAPSKHY